MMTRSAEAAIVIAVVLVLSGCACVTVTKLSPTGDNSVRKGQRFSLPRPYIQVTPQTDGSISADIVYLPDPERTYAVNSFSVFASDSLEVSTEGGIVKTINWTGDSSAVVTEAIASASTVASGILQTEKQQKADQKGKEEAASKAVDDAQLELELAQGTLAFHIANNALPDKILEARLAVNAAALKLSAAQAALARVQGTATSDLHFLELEYAGIKAVEDARLKLEEKKTELARRIANNATRNEISEAELAVENAAKQLRTAQDNLAQITGQAFGPKLFAIREELRQSSGFKTPSPFLEIVTVQQQAVPLPKDWNSPQPTYPIKWPQAPKPPKARIFPEGVTSVPDQNNNRRLTLQASVPLIALVTKETSFERNGTKLPTLPPIALASPTVIDINLDGFPLGDYTLDLAYQTRKHTDPNAVDGKTPVQIKIVR